MHVASRLGDVEVVESLLDNQANLNVLSSSQVRELGIMKGSDLKQDTPLHIASSKENLAVVRLLLGQRQVANVDLVNLKKARSSLKQFWTFMNNSLLEDSHGSGCHSREPPDCTRDCRKSCLSTFCEFLATCR